MASSRTDPQPPDRSAALIASNAAAAGQPEGIDFLALVGTAEDISRRYQTQQLSRTLNRTYRAWRNEHAEGSKYLGQAWRGRTRLFVPKTRAAVRKNLAGAAAALFSTEDVVNITASHEDDPVAQATAAVIKADVDYRLTRTSSKSGFPWFLIAMGGCLDAQLTGATISKQYWQFEEVDDVARRIALFEDPATGKRHHAEVEVPTKRIVKDRPIAEIVAIENVGLDPAAPWYDPCQLGAYFFCDWPIHLTDLRSLMEQSDGAWLDVDEKTLLAGRTEEDKAGQRRVREGGSDRFEEAKAPGELDIVWMRENFFRIGGIDYHFWTVGRNAFLSEIRQTHVAYPEFNGERPYKYGVAQIDTHRVFSMPPVESWQPLQLELNDITNLRLDSLKRSIAPLPIVKRGRNVDLTALQRRGQPETVLLADEITDITFANVPGPNANAFQEASVTNAVFDDLAGVFSGSSVANNRQLNETVGGMRLLSGAANAVAEFDLRVWVETWVEPVLRQLTQLVKARESDEVLLALAGSKARVMTRFRMMPTLDHFDATEVMLRVNVGIGASDPMQRLAKLKAGFEMLTPMAPLMEKQGITPNIEAIIEEVMGGAGFRDGRRFFKFDQAPPEQGQSPELMKLMEQFKIEHEKIDLARQKLLYELRGAVEMNASDNETKLRVEQMKKETTLTREHIAQVGSHALEDKRQRAERFNRLLDVFKERGDNSGAAAAGDVNESANAAPALPAPAQPQAPSAQGNQMVTSAVMAQISQVAEAVRQMSAALAALNQKINAPAEIIRDPEGRPIGVRKGGVEQIIRRGRNNTIEGTGAGTRAATQQPQLSPPGRF